MSSSYNIHRYSILTTENFSGTEIWTTVPTTEGRTSLEMWEKKENLAPIYNMNLEPGSDEYVGR